jgi:hypothetical protein
MANAQSTVIERAIRAIESLTARAAGEACFESLSLLAVAEWADGEIQHEGTAADRSDTPEQDAAESFASMVDHVARSGPSRSRDVEPRLGALFVDLGARNDTEGGAAQLIASTPPWLSPLIARLRPECIHILYGRGSESTLVHGILEEVSRDPARLAVVLSRARPPSTCAPLRTLALLFASNEYCAKNAVRFELRCRRHEAASLAERSVEVERPADDARESGVMSLLAAAFAQLAGDRDGDMRAAFRAVGATLDGATLDGARLGTIGRESTHFRSADSRIEIRLSGSTGAPLPITDMDRAVALLHRVTGYDLEALVAGEQSALALAIDSIVAAEYAIEFERAFRRRFPTEHMLDRPDAAELHARLSRCLATNEAIDLFTPIGPIRTEIVTL